MTVKQILKAQSNKELNSFLNSSSGNNGVDNKKPQDNKKSEEKDNLSDVKDNCKENVNNVAEAEADVMDTSDVKMESEISVNKIPNSSNNTRSSHNISGISIVMSVVALLIVVYFFRKIMRRNKKKYRKYQKQMNHKSITQSPENLENRENIDRIVKVVETPEDIPIQYVSIHNIGGRSSQQDSFGTSEIIDSAYVSNKGFMAVVADGMGGLKDGDKISTSTVVSMLKGFDECENEEVTQSMLLKLVAEANDTAINIIGEDNLGQSGSTVVAIVVKNNILNWISVGDSHIYVCRNESLIKLNRDHNYAAELDEMVSRGEMSVEEALRKPQRAALTSYIGMGNLNHVDQNERPIELESGDRILLMSDGVYGTISGEQLVECMNPSLKHTGVSIENAIRNASKRNQDNYTCIVIEIK